MVPTLGQMPTPAHVSVGPGTHINIWTMKTGGPTSISIPRSHCFGFPGRRHVLPTGQTKRFSVHSAPSTYASQGEQTQTYVSSEARAALFAQAQQIQETPAIVKGTIPHWLQGSLLINGGGDYTGMTHMFDGYAMLCKFKLHQGQATGSQWYIPSKAYRHFSESGSMSCTEFGTPSHANLPPALRFLETMRLMLSGKSIITDNASVNIVPLGGDRMLAVSEPLPSAYQLDLNTEVMSPVTYNDGVPGFLTTAHPQLTADGTLVSFTRSCPLGGYHVYRQDPVSLRRTQIAFIRDRDPLSPCWVHDIAASTNHLVIVEHPLAMNLPSLVTGSMQQCMTWRPELGTRVHVVPLTAGTAEVQTFEAPPFFSFHTANAFEEDGLLHVDLSVYEDATIMQDLQLNQLRDLPGAEISRQVYPAHSTFRSGLRRISIPLSGGLRQLDAPRRLVPDEAAHGHFAEFPCINPRNRGERHRYVWFNGAVRPTNMGNALTKLDVETGELATWHEEGALPGGPVFVAAPEAVAEDQGVIITPVMAKTGHSYLLVLDAANMKELGRAELPYAVPYRFHGAFCAA